MADERRCVFPATETGSKAPPTADTGTTQVNMEEVKFEHLNHILKVFMRGLTTFKYC